MAIETVQIKRGLKANLPRLAEGELALTTDTNEIFLGTANGNIQALNPNLTTQVNTNTSNIQTNTTNIQTNTSQLADMMTDVKNPSYGAKGDGVTDDSQSIQNAINYCVANGRVLYFPKGTYLVKTSLNANGLIGVKGESMSATKILAGASMTTVLVNQNTSRMSIQDITVDGGGLANNCIDTSYSTQGPSLDNTYRRVLVRQYLQTGWIADNNNDCWFEDCMGIEPSNPSTSIGALSANAGGGPLQFINCNFLDDVVVGAQYISFVDCVNKGITIQYSGFNVLKYDGGYLMQGKNNCAIYLPGSSEIGPVTFSGSHIEIPNGDTVFGGTGKVHYGVDFTGTHIMNNSQSPNKLNFLASTITSAFAYCWLRFKGCRIENFNIPNVKDSIGFIYEYVSTYADTVPLVNSTSPMPQNGYSVSSGYNFTATNKNNRVSITGTLNVGTKTNGTIIATLPNGYHPPQQIDFLIAGYDGSYNLYPSVVTIDTSGNIKVWGTFNASMAYLDLDGIVFDV